MAKWGNTDIKQLKELQKQMELFQRTDLEKFYRECAQELAMRLLRKVVKRTPVGDYEDTYEVENDGETKFLVMSGRVGGTLRQGWTVKEIKRSGNIYSVEIINPVEYASYVEYGHRQQPGRYVPAINKRLKKSWVKGHFMLTISEKEIKSIAPTLLEKRIEQKLREVMK